MQGQCDGICHGHEVVVGELQWIKSVWEAGDDVCQNQPLKASYNGGCQSHQMLVVEACYLAFIWHRDDGSLNAGGELGGSRKILKHVCDYQQLVHVGPEDMAGTAPIAMAPSGPGAFHGFTFRKADLIYMTLAVGTGGPKVVGRGI